MKIASQLQDWPPLPFAEWEETCATLHLWTQVIGKIRLAQAPMLNHWWQAPLYVTARGLTTSAMPHGNRIFQIDFDFIDHRLLMVASDGAAATVSLVPRAVAEFYAEVTARLREMGLEVRISTLPSEIPDPVPFEADRGHAAYDAESANRFWRVLVQADRVLREFRASYLGKVSPVHFFWGGFDLAVTRFSGRPAPPHGPVPNIPLSVVREAYSHEVSSCGFWPGNGGFGRPAFYAYAYPEPAGFGDAAIEPPAAFYARELGEFVLPYDDVRQAAAPDDMLLGFLQSTYEAAARLGNWDRTSLERPRAT